VFSCAGYELSTTKDEVSHVDWVEFDGEIMEVGDAELVDHPTGGHFHEPSVGGPVHLEVQRC